MAKSQLSQTNVQYANPSLSPLQGEGQTRVGEGNPHVTATKTQLSCLPFGRGEADLPTLKNEEV